MSPAGALLYMGGALAYAAALTLGLLGVVWLLGRRPSLPRLLADGALALATFFVIFLAIHPFPDPAMLDCGQGGAAIRLRPFGFADPYRRFWAEGRPLGDWLTHTGIVAPVMNVVLFALPGAALALHTRSWGGALVFGVALGLFNELSQLSALYGIYPCRYRQFETDDLILNPAGVLLGFALVRQFRGAYRP